MFFFLHIVNKSLSPESILSPNLTSSQPQSDVVHNEKDKLPATTITRIGPPCKSNSNILTFNNNNIIKKEGRHEVDCILTTLNIRKMERASLCFYIEVPIVNDPNICMQDCFKAVGLRDEVDISKLPRFGGELASFKYGDLNDSNDYICSILKKYGILLGDYFTEQYFKFHLTKDYVKKYIEEIKRLDPTNGEEKAHNVIKLSCRKIARNEAFCLLLNKILISLESGIMYSQSVNKITMFGDTGEEDVYIKDLKHLIYGMVTDFNTETVCSIHANKQLGINNTGKSCFISHLC